MARWDYEQQARLCVCVHTYVLGQSARLQTCHVLVSEAIRLSAGRNMDQSARVLLRCFVRVYEGEAFLNLTSFHGTTCCTFSLSTSEMIWRIVEKNFSEIGFWNHSHRILIQYENFWFFLWACLACSVSSCFVLSLFTLTRRSIPRACLRALCQVLWTASEWFHIDVLAVLKIWTIYGVVNMHYFILWEVVFDV